jgi:hypothetical protein
MVVQKNGKQTNEYLSGEEGRKTCRYSQHVLQNSYENAPKFTTLLRKSQVKISKILMKVCGNSQHLLQNSHKIVWKFTTLLSKFLQNHMEIHNRS